jgi:hypothetical protein
VRGLRVGRRSAEQLRRRRVRPSQSRRTRSAPRVLLQQAVDPLHARLPDRSGKRCRPRASTDPTCAPDRSSAQSQTHSTARTRLCAIGRDVFVADGSFGKTRLRAVRWQLRNAGQSVSLRTASGTSALAVCSSERECFWVRNAWSHALPRVLLRGEGCTSSILRLGAPSDRHFNRARRGHRDRAMPV